MGKKPNKQHRAVPQQQQVQQKVQQQSKQITKSTSVPIIEQDNLNEDASLTMMPDTLRSMEYLSTYATSNLSEYASAPLGKYKFAGPSVTDRLALVMMIKNEERRIEVTLESVRKICKTFIILDTGSTDRTIDIVTKYCKRHDLTLHLKEEPFVNFEVSRNVLLDFADDVLKHHYFLLHLDCNDELQSHDELAQAIESHANGMTFTGFHLRQQWWSGRALDSYLNTRMAISHFGWRYRGVVHEVLMRNPGKDALEVDIVRLNNVIIYQDRTNDDDKTLKRFKRDKVLLYEEHLKNPTEPRTLFYLAQTCSCLHQHQEAYEYYLLRTKCTNGFWEEVAQSFFRLGNIAYKNLKHPWEECLDFYLKSYSISHRIEPLIAIANHYMYHGARGENQADYHLAYMFLQQACRLVYPIEQGLFCDKNMYLYERWHMLGIVAFYVNRFEEGKEACIRALMAKETERDLSNLKFYMDKQRAIQESKHHKEDITRHCADRHMMMSYLPSYGDLDHWPKEDVPFTVGRAFTREEILRKVAAL